MRRPPQLPSSRITRTRFTIVIPDHAKRESGIHTAYPNKNTPDPVLQLTTALWIPDSATPIRNDGARTLNIFGAPGRTRTCNPRLRRPVLYPVELRALFFHFTPMCRSAKQNQILNGRGGGIRTPDPLLPKQLRYQAALHPDTAYSRAMLRSSREFVNACPQRFYRRMCKQLIYGAIQEDRMQ